VISYVGSNVEHLKGRTTVDEGGRLVPHFSPDQVRTFKPIFTFLNDKDVDILYLIFVTGKRQMDVTRILNRTQSSLAYDIKRIRRRLRFIHYLQEVFDIFLDFVRRERDNDCFTPNELEILTLMFYTSSFTHTARVVKTTPVRVRQTYTKCIRRMEERDMWDAYEIFTVIRSNLNIVKRVYPEGKPKSGRASCLPKTVER
jgi:hypothetical protein